MAADAVATGPWGRPLRPLRPFTAYLRGADTDEGGGSPPDAAPHTDRGTGTDAGSPLPLRPAKEEAPVDRPPYSMVRPPPPPPLAPGRDERQLGRRSRSLPGRRWPLEALAAVVLLFVMGAVFHPTAPSPPTPAERWLEANSHRIVALARDIAGLQGSLLRATTASSRPRAAAPPILRLRADLDRAEHLGAPPVASVRRIWTSALEEAGAALRILTTSGAAPTATRLASARADLDAAGQALVAVSAGAHSPAPILPH